VPLDHFKLLDLADLSDAPSSIEAPRDGVVMADTAKKIIFFYSKLSDKTWPRENLRKVAPLLKSIHFIGAGIESLRLFDWVPRGIKIINNRGIHRQKENIYIYTGVPEKGGRSPHARMEDKFGIC
jgi:hypothetical protein